MSVPFEILNFGCRTSQADGAALQAAFEQNGMHRAGPAIPADIVVLNTCTVTAAADHEIRRTVHRIHRERPAAQIIVTGCYAQRAPRELAQLPGVVLVVGNSHKDQLTALLRDPVPFHGAIHVGDISAQTTVPLAAVAYGGGDHARPNLKIQDGCNNRCSFCVIPAVRGRSRSVDPGAVVREVRRLSRDHAEIVLTGINLGRWGREPGSAMRLPELLRHLLEETDISMIRLSSVEPMDWSDDLIELVAASPRIARHMHAPLQSGSDAVLRRMYRKYRPLHYEDRVRRAHAAMPDAGIGADVMTGFPGETEAEFEESRAFIEALPFTYLHVFPYSERPGTKAAALADQVPPDVRRRRARILIELGTQKNAAFRAHMAGRTFPAAVLNDGLTAVTTNYLRVALPAPRPPRTLIQVELGPDRAAATAGSSAPPLFPLHPTNFPAGCSR